jgi:hypothetical protein
VPRTVHHRRGEGEVEGGGDGWGALSSPPVATTALACCGLRGHARKGVCAGRCGWHGTRWIKKVHLHTTPVV